MDLAGDIVPDFDQRLATLSAQDTLATRTADGKIPLTERVGILNRAFAQLGYSYDKSLIAVLKRPDIVQLVRLDARSILDVLHCPLDALDEPGAMDMVTKGYLSEECYRLLVQTKHKVLTQKSDTLSTQS